MKLIVCLIKEPLIFLFDLRYIFIFPLVCCYPKYSSLYIQLNKHSLKIDTHKYYFQLTPLTSFFNLCLIISCVEVLIEITGVCFTFKIGFFVSKCCLCVCWCVQFTLSEDENMSKIMLHVHSFNYKYLLIRLIDLKIEL